MKDESSSYHYNAVHRWYYDAASSMYYGGEPPTWTKVPDLPSDAKYEAMAAPSAVTGAMLRLFGMIAWYSVAVAAMNVGIPFEMSLQ